MQCDVGVTADEWLDPEALLSYKVTGFGGSDMSPAMLQLADDPEVAAVLVLTDGYITFPAAEPPSAASSRSSCGGGSLGRPGFCG